MGHLYITPERIPYCNDHDTSVLKLNVHMDALRTNASCGINWPPSWRTSLRHWIDWTPWSTCWSPSVITLMSGCWMKAVTLWLGFTRDPIDPCSHQSVQTARFQWTIWLEQGNIEVIEDVNYSQREDPNQRSKEHWKFERQISFPIETACPKHG